MARLVVLALVLITALLLQTVIAPALTIAGVQPPLLTLTVVGLAVQDGAGTGVRYGFSAGLASDLLSAGEHLVGLRALVLLLVGFGVGLARPYMASGDLVAQIAVGGFGVIFAVAGEGLLRFTLGLPGPPLTELGEVALIAGLYGAALGPIVSRIVGAIARRVPLPAQST